MNSFKVRLTFLSKCVAKKKWKKDKTEFTFGSKTATLTFPFYFFLIFFFIAKIIFFMPRNIFKKFNFFQKKNLKFSNNSFFFVYGIHWNRDLTVYSYRKLNFKKFCPIPMVVGLRRCSFVPFLCFKLFFFNIFRLKGGPIGFPGLGCHFGRSWVKGSHWVSQG